MGVLLFYSFALFHPEPQNQQRIKTTSKFDLNPSAQNLAIKLIFVRTQELERWNMLDKPSQNKWRQK